MRKYDHNIWVRQENPSGYKMHVGKHAFLRAGHQCIEFNVEEVSTPANYSLAGSSAPAC